MSILKVYNFPVNFVNETFLDRRSQNINKKSYVLIYLKLNGLIVAYCIEQEFISDV